MRSHIRDIAELAAAELGVAIARLCIGGHGRFRRGSTVAVARPIQCAGSC